jgi:hypothetical protein
VIRKNFLVLLLLIESIRCAGQDTTAAINCKKSHWYLPDGISTEYAGGFGMISAGVLYGNKRSELTLTIGYVPPAYGKIWTGNLLASYTILPVTLSESVALNILKTGAFVNMNFGKNIYLTWPEYYPRQYYWWNSSLRFGPFVDTEIKYKPSKGSLNYTVFFQCLTNDLYLYTYLPNRKNVDLNDVIYYGAGLKIHFRDGGKKQS